MSITATWAQNKEAEVMIGDMLEEMAVDEKLSDDGMEAASMTVSSWAQPLDINKATRADLNRLFFLTPTQIEGILKRREQVTQFVTPQEFLTIPGFSEKDVERLFLFAQIGDINPQASRNSYWKQDAVLRLHRIFPKQKGYKKRDTADAPYLGDPYRILFRVNGSVGREWNYGYVMEKDAGEPMFGKGTTLTDFVSGFVVYKPQKSVVRQVILGHFAAQYGQGLGMWAGFSSDGSATQNSIHRRARGLISTMSSSEFGYLRGGGISLGHGNIHGDVYLSVMDGDATPLVDADGNTFFSSIRSDGQHRTESEYRTRKNLTQHTLGTYLTYKKKNTHIAAGYHTWHGSMPWGRDGQAYRAFLPEGKWINTFHTDYFYASSRVALYGELVYQDMKTLAGMQGIDVSLGNGNSATVAFRKFGKKYYPINQNPHSVTARPGGETGFYAAITLVPVSKLTIQGKVDIYKNAWIQMTKPFLTDGYKSRITLSYLLPAKNTLTLKVKHDNREDGEAEDRTLITDKKRTSARLAWSSQQMEWLFLRTSIEQVHTSENGANTSDGFWIAQEARFSFEKPNIDLAMMFAHFDTDDYDSRVYTYQPDVLYSMSTPSYSGKGVNALASFKYGITRGVNLYLWGNYTKYYHQQTIGSGNGEIDGSHRFEAKVQLQVKLNKLLPKKEG